MKKLVIFLMLIMMLSVHVPSQTLAKGGLIKSIINFFKVVGTILLKQEMTPSKVWVKLKRKFLMRIKSRTTSETISTSSAEARIAENVGIDQHSVNFTNLKEYSKGKIYKEFKG